MALRSDSTSSQYQLPNGMQIHHLNKHESEFLYNEIFVDRIYLQGGVKLPAGATVIDIGANIGLFTLFVKNLAPDARILAFEPVPELYGILRRNTEKFADTVVAHQCGISDEESTAEFTYYPGYSLMSSFKSDHETDLQMLSASVRGQMAATDSKPNQMSEKIVQVLVDNKLKNKIKFDCSLFPISRFIREAGLKQIDLLKIDAEKAEIQVLEGIEEAHWPLIQQVVLETHSPAETAKVTEILEGRGFRVTGIQEAQLSESGITNVFAVRP